MGESLHGDVTIHIAGGFIANRQSVLVSSPIMSGSDPKRK
jgi:hypothetical protein